MVWHRAGSEKTACFHRQGSYVGEYEWAWLPKRMDRSWEWQHTLYVGEGLLNVA